MKKGSKLEMYRFMEMDGGMWGRKGSRGESERTA